MIKFFRRLRKTFLDDNKYRMYVIYAIGEIILVMIGILLALQVNNWNEQRKSNNVELQLLHSFKHGLQQDIDDIHVNVDFGNRSVASADTLITLLESNKPYDVDRICGHFSQLMIPTYFQYSTSAFETLKSMGINTIKNEELRDLIIAVYDAQYTFFLSNQKVHIAEIERGFNEVFPTRFKESHSNFLRQGGGIGILRPLNFEALKRDQEFLYYIKSLKNRTVLLLDYQYNRLENKINELMTAIETEIDKLES